MATTGTENEKNSPSRSYHALHRVFHQQQLFNWDCGVACVLMLLPEASRNSLLDNFDLVCEEEGFGQSTWTIDLCYLLKRFGIQHTMYTTMFGVNESYRKHSYYSRILEVDRARVTRRFASAAAAGLKVFRAEDNGRGGADALVRHVATEGPVILLVDAGRLSCDLCKHNKLRMELRRWLGGGYRGHYVVVVGVSGGGLLYRDPALSARLCRASAARLHAARAPGTDRDAVFVHRDYR